MDIEKELLEYIKVMAKELKKGNDLTVKYNKNGLQILKTELSKLNK